MLSRQSLADCLKGQSVLEPMSGWGRNIPVIQKAETSSITIVDINPKAIKMANDYYNDQMKQTDYDKNIYAFKAYC